MKELMIFGKNTQVTEQESRKEHLEDLLHSQLLQIYNDIKKEGKIEIYGDIDFEILERIDNKKQRIAKIKGREIQVKLTTIALPIDALKYIVAHELAHILTKRHKRRFWKILETIYPNYEEGRKLLMKHGNFLYEPLTRLPKS